MVSSTRNIGVVSSQLAIDVDSPVLFRNCVPCRQTNSISTDGHSLRVPYDGMFARRDFLERGRSGNLLIRRCDTIKNACHGGSKLFM